MGPHLFRRVMLQWETWFCASESNRKAGCRKPSCSGMWRHHLPFRRLHQLTWMSQGWAQPWNPQSPTVSLRPPFPSRTNSWHRIPTEWVQKFSYCLRLPSLKRHGIFNTSQTPWTSPRPPGEARAGTGGRDGVNSDYTLILCLELCQKHI